MSNLKASDVRSYFRANEARMGRLSPAAAKTVSQGARGLIHPEAIKVFNSPRRKDKRYDLRTGAVLTSQATEALKEQRAALKSAGLDVKDRGRLSKEALEFLKNQ